METKDIQMRMYRFYFLDGTVKHAQGDSCAQAWLSLGYTLGDINLLNKSVILHPYIVPR